MRKSAIRGELRNFLADCNQLLDLVQLVTFFKSAAHHLPTEDTAARYVIRVSYVTRGPTVHSCGASSKLKDSPKLGEGWKLSGPSRPAATRVISVIIFGMRWRVQASITDHE